MFIRRICMKLNKDQQKEMNNFIRVYSKEKGYNAKMNTIFILKGTAFAFCDFLIVNSKKIIYRIYVKEYDYDNIFWKILRMDENIKKNNSLRACGAFKAPAILLKSGEFELTIEYEQQAKTFVELIDGCVCEFIKNHRIDEYVIEKEDGMDAEVLKCLAYLHMDKKVEAMRVAKNANDNAISSNYENNGKTFWEWVLLSK